MDTATQRHLCERFPLCFLQITQGDVLITEKLKGVDVGNEIDLDEVLLLANKHHSYIGRPFVPAVEVHVTLFCMLTKYISVRAYCNIFSDALARA